MEKSSVSQELYAGRLLAHGKITAAQMAAGFKLKSNELFSICVVPKAATTNTLLIVDLKLGHDDVTSDLPCPLSDWTPGFILELAPNAIELGDYDVYWATGIAAKPTV
jgi:hypothetical protein